MREVSDLVSAEQRLVFQSGTQVDIEPSACFHTSKQSSFNIVTKRRWQSSER